MRDPVSLAKEKNLSRACDVVEISFKGVIGCPFSTS